MLDVQRFWEVVLFSWITGNSNMHCKNFSLLNTGGREYVLAPAYDLLAVLLADPTDTEEMAMSFTVGGKKSGFDRQTFLGSMTASGIPLTVAERLINTMTAHAPQWENLIEQSFLPEDLKTAYLHLLTNRLGRL